MFVCASLWSIAGIFFKLIDWNPFVIAGFRSLIAAAAVRAYMLATNQKVVITKNVLISMFFLSATFLCFVSANKLTTSANAIVLQFTSPIFLLIFSALVFRQKFKTSDILTVLGTVGGIAVFFLGSLSDGQISGDIIAVISGVTMAGMYISVGKTAGNEKMSGILFGHILTAAVGIPFLFFTKGTVSWVSVSAIIVLGIFQLGIPYILYGLASSNCPPLACNLIAAVEPLLNPVWVLIFNGERPGLFSIIGGIIVITAVTAQCVLHDKKAKTVPEAVLR
jgi:drug/metabolite transporter (DMT)-like permease